MTLPGPISMLTFFPLLAGLAVLCVPAQKTSLSRGGALFASLCTLPCALWLAASFDITKGTLQWVERHDWIRSLAIEYHAGADGLSLLMILLTSLLLPMAILASWNIRKQVSLYFALMLFLQTGLIGTFTAQNFFHWFLYWELSLIPAFFLVRLWGGPDRAEAATQFFVYTMAGSVALLLGFLALFLCTGTMDFQALSDLAASGKITAAISDTLGWRDLTTRAVSLAIFFCVFLGFAVKVPLFPFHTWLPGTYSSAPIGVTMLLTGLMSKMGVYGFIRILLPIFPAQMYWMLKPLFGLVVLSIVFSAAAAWRQTDLKRTFAYSSINHLGYCLLGVVALATASTPQVAAIEKVAALSGVMLQMFNHGLVAATLFWMIAVLQERSGGRTDMAAFGGVRQVAPVLTGFMGIALFASLGLPGLNGFVGEFLIFKGVFALAKLPAFVSLAGLLLTAIFILGILQNVFSGRLKVSGFADLTTRERLVLGVPLFLMLLLGIFPQLLLGIFNATSMHMVERLGF